MRRTYISGLIKIALILSFPITASALTTYSEDFDTRTVDTTINGQGEWFVYEGDPSYAMVRSTGVPGTEGKFSGNYLEMTSTTESYVLPFSPFDESMSGIAPVSNEHIFFSIDLAMNGFQTENDAKFELELGTMDGAALNVVFQGDQAGGYNWQTYSDRTHQMYDLGFDSSENEQVTLNAELNFDTQEFRVWKNSETKGDWFYFRTPETLSEISFLPIITQQPTTAEGTWWVDNIDIGTEITPLIRNATGQLGLEETNAIISAAETFYRTEGQTIDDPIFDDWIYFDADTNSEIHTWGVGQGLNPGDVFTYDNMQGIWLGSGIMQPLGGGVPEPSTVVLFILGFLGLGFRFIKKKKLC